jgi:molybdate transport system substrate-binding protein
VSGKWEWRVGLVEAAVVVGVLAVLLVATLRSPGSAPTVLPVRIAAAADLRFALDDAMAAFHADHLNVAPEVVYGSSGTLASQIANGAPFDLFMSADVEYPRQLAAKGLVEPGSEFRYADGRLVVWVPNGSPIDVKTAGVKAAADPRVAHVAIANPAHAPYGRAAVAALRAAGVYDAVQPKLVLGESVAQAMQFVQSGSADVGIVALSLAMAPTARAAGEYAIVPAGTYPKLEQAGVILRNAREQAHGIREFLLSERGRAVLKRYGFDPAEP